MKDLAEVCAITRAVILTRVIGRNGYPDHYNRAFAFSAILYPTSYGLSLRSAFLDPRVEEKVGLTTFRVCT